MAVIGVDILKTSNDKFRTFLEKKGVSLFDLLRAAFKRLCEKFLNDKEVSYTYNPITENKRAKLGEFITEHFKNKAEFAKEAGLDLSVLVALISNRRCGNALTWKKINDAFEKRGVKLPYDLQIKYEVVGKFGQK